MQKTRIILLVWAALASMPVLLNAQTVHTAGAARNVMTGKDLSPRISLDSLGHMPYLVALGPVNDLQGEITAVDGVVYRSAVLDGKIVTARGADVKAPFLVYADVPRWSYSKLRVKLSALNDLEHLIDSLAVASGFDQNEAFPFRVSGVMDSLYYHVIMRDTSQKTHSHELHHKAKQHFTMVKQPVELVGFFSRNHEGVFTHKGHFIHVHCLAADRSVTGHLDGLAHLGEVIISLPAR